MPLEYTHTAVWAKKTLIGSTLGEHPPASSPRFIDYTRGLARVPLPFEQVQHFIHPLGGERPVLPEILEGLHLASQRLRSCAQSPVQSAPAIRQGLAPASGPAPGTRPKSCFFLPGIASSLRHLDPWK
jgi:hypothetical protein